jgi:hypothetical protein
LQKNEIRTTDNLPLLKKNGVRATVILPLLGKNEVRVIRKRIKKVYQPRLKKTGVGAEKNRKDFIDGRSGRHL